MITEHCRDKNIKYRIKLMVYVILSISFMFIMGLFYFSLAIIPNAKNSYKDEKVDSIIVTTGEVGRIEAGIQLFAKGKAKLLLISGVGKNFSKSHLNGYLKKHNINQANVILGHSANNTEGNADESQAFMLINNFKSMVLVTNSIHMPRTLMLFKEKMPEYDIKIHPISNKQQSTWKYYRTVTKEYSKLVFTYIANSINYWHMRYNKWIENLV